jgi:hypothetical protein
MGLFSRRASSNTTSDRDITGQPASRRGSQVSAAELVAKHQAAGRAARAKASRNGWRIRPHQSR